MRLYNRKNDKDINALVDEYPHALYIFFLSFKRKKNIQYSFSFQYVRLNTTSFTSVNNQNFRTQKIGASKDEDKKCKFSSNRKTYAHTETKEK